MEMCRRPVLPWRYNKTKSKHFRTGLTLQSFKINNLLSTTLLPPASFHIKLCFESVRWCKQVGILLKPSFQLTQIPNKVLSSAQPAASSFTTSWELRTSWALLWGERLKTMILPAHSAVSRAGLCLGIETRGGREGRSPGWRPSQEQHGGENTHTVTGLELLISKV